MSKRTLLSLPIEEQQQMAKEAGCKSLSDWQQGIINSFIDSRYVFELPIEVQQEIAKSKGYDNVEDWAFAKQEEWRKVDEDGDYTSGSILEEPLDIERLREIAKVDGAENFDEWLEEIREILRSAHEEGKKHWEGHSLEEAKSKIKELKTDPYFLRFYRRVNRNQSLSVEDMIFAIHQHTRF